MSHLILLGTSHKTASVELRERLALSPGRLGPFLAELHALPELDEAVALSTCNRTELVVAGPDPVAAEAAALGALAREAGRPPTELVPALYAHRNCEVARHLFRVAAGLDSMVVGEHEVQGQVKRAYEAALRAGTSGPLCNRLFRAALHTGKRVRGETALAERALSVPGVAVALAREALGELRDRAVVVIGAGETAELTAEALHAQGVATLFVANRRRDRAIGLAQRFGGEAVRFDDLPEALGRADIVVASTASPHVLLEAEEVGAVMAARGGRPLLLIDIAVPRDVDPACAGVPGVTLRDIDDLQAVAEGRPADVAQAEAVVEEEIRRFATWLGSLEVLPTLAALRERGREVVEGVLADNEGRWEAASPRDRERIEQVAQAVANRLLHEPTLRLKGTEPERRHTRLQVLRELFALDEAAEPAAGPADVRPLRRRAQG